MQDRKYDPFFVRIPREKMSRVRDLAKLHDRSVNKEILCAVNEYLARQFETVREEEVDELATVE